MTEPSCSEADFIKLIETYGPTEAAKRLNCNPRTVYRRRENLEQKYKRKITGPDPTKAKRNYVEHSARLHLEVRNGIVLVGSDAHYWPEDPSPAHRALVAFAKEYKPKALIMNGDALDAARISRHPPIGWESRPTLVDEIETCKDRLHELREAVGRDCRTPWALGNHDARFETRLATVAPEYARINGVALHDHFPLWEPAWSVWINNDVVVKHRWKGGVHATHNNTVGSGKSIITGHLHSAKVTPYTDYTGTRYGVDTGCLANTFGPQFVDYTEDGPLNWRSAFGFLTFRDGVLMYPELVLVWDKDHVQFRGEIIKV